MPIYQLVHAGVPLNIAERDRLARGITEIHHSETNAPEPFIRVAFEPLPLGTVYTAGRITPSFMVSCGIRAGRSDATRQRIVQRVYELIAEVTQLPPDQIMVVATEIPSSWIMEAGFFLPPATDEAEAEWIKQLQAAYPGQFDEWGDGRRPSFTDGGADRSADLRALVQEMIDQVKREGGDAAEALEPVTQLIKSELVAVRDFVEASRHAAGRSITAATGSTADAAQADPAHPTHAVPARGNQTGATPAAAGRPAAKRSATRRA